MRVNRYVGAALFIEYVKGTIKIKLNKINRFLMSLLGLMHNINTNAHVGRPCFMETLYRRNDFYTVQTVLSIPLP